MMVSNTTLSLVFLPVFRNKRTYVLVMVEVEVEVVVEVAQMVKKAFLNLKVKMVLNQPLNLKVKKIIDEYLSQKNSKNLPPVLGRVYLPVKNLIW